MYKNRNEQISYKDFTEKNLMLTANLHTSNKLVNYYFSL